MGSYRHIQHLLQQKILISPRTPVIQGSLQFLQNGILFGGRTLCQGCFLRRFSMMSSLHHQNIPQSYSKNHTATIPSSLHRFLSSSSTSSSPPTKPPSSSSHSGKTTASDTKDRFISREEVEEEFLLYQSDLRNLTKVEKPNGSKSGETVVVFIHKEVEKRAIQKYGSLQFLEKLKEQQKIAEQRIRYRRLIQELDSEIAKEEKPYAYNPIKNVKESQETIFNSGTGQVVLMAVGFNAFNALIKLWGWYMTKSHSMFAEFIHSVADTVNQMVIAGGLYFSLKAPDKDHPYGWASVRNLTSLISGVGIFFFGAGLTIMNGVTGLFHSSEMVDSLWGVGILAGSFITEGTTLAVAIRQTMNSAKIENLSFMEYVRASRDPSTNVVLLEDFVSVSGVGVAALCMGLSYMGVAPLADPIGSIVIGVMLGAVAMFIIHTNTLSLIGRSIPLERRQDMIRTMEDDRMIRIVQDVKATDMGGSYTRFKAEVDMDGLELSRAYIQNLNPYQVLRTMRNCKTPEDAKALMQMHGEQILNRIGPEIKRIEGNLRKKYPDIRHIDLEML